MKIMCIICNILIRNSDIEEDMEICEFCKKDQQREENQY